MRRTSKFLLALGLCALAVMYLQLTSSKDRGSFPALRNKKTEAKNPNIPKPVGTPSIPQPPPLSNDIGLHQKLAELRNEVVTLMGRYNESCVTTRYDPYAISGIPIEKFKAEYQTWPKSCIPLMFSRTLKFPKTALASFPGSGNTWSRHLIQQLTGIYIGSIYYDILYQNKQPSSFGAHQQLVWNGSCIAIKTHEGWANTPLQADRFDKAILIIRSPRHSILADFKRVHWNVHTNKLSQDDIFADKHFEKFFNTQVADWVRFNKQWLSTHLCTLVVLYEDLKADLHKQLLRIAYFLGIDIHSLKDEHLECIVENSGGSLKWPRAPPPRGLYTHAMNATIRANEDVIRNILREKYGMAWKTEDA